MCGHFGSIFKAFLGQKTKIIFVTFPYKYSTQNLNIPEYLLNIRRIQRGGQRVLKIPKFSQKCSCVSCKLWVQNLADWRRSNSTPTNETVSLSKFWGQKLQVHFLKARENF